MRNTPEKTWDMSGGALWLDREEWGVVIDALILHRAHADARKAVNSESTSDVRSEICERLITRINRASAEGNVMEVPC